MPIEFWWWIEPLWLTGYLALVIFGILSLLLDKAKPDSLISNICAIIAFLPWVVSAASVIVWLIINALILIWR